MQKCNINNVLIIEITLRHGCSPVNWMIFSELWRANSVFSKENEVMRRSFRRVSLKIERHLFLRILLEV